MKISLGPEQGIAEAATFDILDDTLMIIEEFKKREAEIMRNFNTAVTQLQQEQKMSLAVLRQNTIARLTAK